MARTRPARSRRPPQPVYVPEAQMPARAKTKAGVKKPKPHLKRRKLTKKNRQTTRIRLGSMDSLLNESASDPLGRQDRWVPEIGKRTQPVEKPIGIPADLWTAYCALDDWIYEQGAMETTMSTADDEGKPYGVLRGERAQPRRKPPQVHSAVWTSYTWLEKWMYMECLPAKEIVCLPLMDDVLDYQAGIGEQPVTPKGYKWFEQELVPVDHQPELVVKKRRGGPKGSKSKETAKEGVGLEHVDDVNIGKLVYAKGRKDDHGEEARPYRDCIKGNKMKIMAEDLDDFIDDDEPMDLAYV
ncbi:hypothetical protein BJ170DRAFT_679376 [Xylariales sp. AK1849]|nr:hypothetical protein BJ170DRAFT_679376 [Xylariales sp. AK1849]